MTVITIIDIPVATVDVDGRTYDVFDLNHNYEDAISFCESREEKLLPLDIGDSVGTRIHLTKISQKIEEHNNTYDDIDIWFSYRRNEISGLWEFEYTDLDIDADNLGWSVCDPVLDFHNNQPHGSNQNCLAFHYRHRYLGSPTECTWGMYDHPCENTWVKDRLTVCTKNYELGNNIILYAYQLDNIYDNQLPLLMYHIEKYPHYHGQIYLVFKNFISRLLLMTQIFPNLSFLIH